MAVSIEESAVGDPGVVDCSVAGMPATGEFRCAACGYGAVIHRVLPLCPMCGGTVWEPRGARASRSLS